MLPVKWMERLRAWTGGPCLAPKIIKQITSFLKEVWVCLEVRVVMHISAFCILECEVFTVLQHSGFFKEGKQ